VRRAALILLGTATLVAGACARREPAAPERHPRPDVLLPRETETIQSIVPRHATLDSLLRAGSLQDQLVVEAVTVARAVFDPRQIREGRPYRLVRSLDGLLREFEYQIDADRFLRIVNINRDKPEALDARVLPYEKDTELTGIDARIDAAHTSLIEAIDGAGETIALALDLADIFSGQVDFQTELQPGDSFKVFFEKSFLHDGPFSSYGAILGASIVVDGRTLTAFRWTDPATGKPAYYDENGRSLKRFFLKSPLKFEPRITSRFSMRRFHPVDHVYRAHLGVDYAAPIGASVVAVANGTVVSAARSGPSGNMVRLKHPGGFETYYLHLSAYGPGIRAGAHVAQGQLIGRVGMTGSATGPHLDYRLKKNGVFVNPVAAHSRQAPGEPIPTVQLAGFKASRDSVLSRLATALAQAPRPKPDAVTAAQR
jgi:murein DD-endopeptidase MepM/ murein hydrolase activator NlpD